MAASNRSCGGGNPGVLIRLNTGDRSTARRPAVTERVETRRSQINAGTGVIACQNQRKLERRVVCLTQSIKPESCVERRKQGFFAEGLEQELRPRRRSLPEGAPHSCFER